MISRRTFLASLTAALVQPRLALPAPSKALEPDAIFAPDLVIYREVVVNMGFPVVMRYVLAGETAKRAIKESGHLWSAVMVDRRLF